MPGFDLPATVSPGGRGSAFRGVISTDGQTGSSLPCEEVEGHRGLTARTGAIFFLFRLRRLLLTGGTGGIGEGPVLAMVSVSVPGVVEISCDARSSQSSGMSGFDLPVTVSPGGRGSAFRGVISTDGQTGSSLPCEEVEGHRGLTARTGAIFFLFRLRRLLLTGVTGGIGEAMVSVSVPGVVEISCDARSNQSSGMSHTKKEIANFMFNIYRYGTTGTVY